MGWLPRSSKMGAYLACDYRAALDRMVDAGDIAAPDDPASPYADLGTCEHFELQDGMRCTWPDGDSTAHKYTDAQFANASTFFGRDPERTLSAIRHVAAYSALRLPKSPDGMPWRAEWKFKSKYFTGTVDFLSADGTVVGDLKTTSKPPAGNKIKTPHLIQMICYHVLTGAKSGWIFYVDSKNGSWSLTIPIDFLSPAMQELTEQVKAYALYLKSKKLFAIAVPRMGEHCSDNFCPYRGTCRDKFMPPAAVPHDASIVHAKSNMTPFGATAATKV